jgi:nicotinate-nucleotide pyrophosphorylase (carboxylating)
MKAFPSGRLFHANCMVKRNSIFAFMIDFYEKLHQLIDSALKEDVGDGDHSTLSCIPADAKGKAVLKIKQDGILAGLEVAREFFLYKEPSSIFTAFKKDGDEIRGGEMAFEVLASIHTILKCERLLLNCMQRMSGIATLTKSYTDKLKGYKTKVLDTRKTTPNFRLLEKEAVRIGGGANHRFGLYDMIMLKDNHIDFCGSLEKAIERASDYVRSSRPELKMEVEARTIDDVKKIIKMGSEKVFRIMLDNFTPLQIEDALKIINADGATKFEIEASGGINLDNIEEYAKTGVDYVSVGGLIHQAKSLDLSLKAVIV